MLGSSDMSEAKDPPRSRIAVLPPELADQIAAGEVVERAASVVKELVENAIDAGARKVDVEIEGGGRRSIRVTDDGSGMTADEARLALRRHATSKIRRADDLWGLATFGFRGEALPSIAAVSRLTLATKRAADPGDELAARPVGGFRLGVEAGVETEAREVGIPEGTQIEVRDLFFNTPARLKFQKTEATEAANVTEAVLRLALGHPDVHLRLRISGRTALDLPGHRSLAERVRAALARRGAGALHEARGEEAGCQVHAFLAAPEEAATTARSTFLFVGRRFVRDRSLLHALSLGYGELLEKGRYPLAALFLEVPGAELDVNVHPQKLEVRFARAAEVYAAVRHTVGAAVARAPWLPAGRAAVRGHTLPPERAPATAGDGDGESERAGGGGALRASAPGASAGADDGWPARRAAWAGTSQLGLGRGEAALGRWLPSRTGASVGVGFAPVAGAVASRAADGYGPEPTPAPSSMEAPTGAFGREDAGAAVTAAGDSGFFQSLSYVGQLHKTYLICEADFGEGGRELVLVDQHAAHERVAFERLRAEHARREIRRQRLLFPVPLALGDLAATARAEIAALDALGFELEVAAGAGDADVVTVLAVPEPLASADPKPLLRDVLGQLADGGPARGAADRIDHLLATMACHSVVRAGDVLGRPQALALLAQLDGVDLRSHCPHGRPVLLRVPLTEIERRFGRI
jgi:DNA mismatch repair protein MutL